jgi:hypothetical protein
MKYFITFVTAATLLSSCGKKADEAPKTVVPNSVSSDSAEKQTAALNNAISHMDKNKMKTARGTLDALINLPEGSPVPPFLRPVQDLKLTSETDSSATYSFVSGSTGIKAKIEEKKMIIGSDTMWTVSPAVPIK